VAHFIFGEVFSCALKIELLDKEGILKHAWWWSYSNHSIKLGQIYIKKKF